MSRTPVHKKEVVYNISNYRPIAILPVISNVFERLINEQLRAFLESNNVISEAQYDFRRKRSCETALLSLTKKLFQVRESKLFSCASAIDFSRAFDTVNLNVLSSRIAAIADMHTANWFNSYLTHRLQSTKYCDVVSDPRELLSGVPERSVLGSTLIIIYINDLLKSFPSGSVVAYADDVSLLPSSATLAEVVANAEAALAYVSTRAESNGLVISISKCAAMLVSPHIKKTTVAQDRLRLAKAVLNIVHEMRVLGVTLSSDLKWSTHASNVRASVSKMAGVFNSFRCSLNMRTRQKILQAFIVPKLVYCLLV